MALTLVQNVALIVMLATIQRYLSRRLPTAPWVRSVVSGVLYGLVAVIGMMIPFQLAEGIFYDGRSIVMGLAGFFGGAPVAIIAGLITAGYRFYLGGAGVPAGVLTIVFTAAAGIGFHYLVRARPGMLRIPGLVAFGVLLHLAMLTAQFLLLPRDALLSIIGQVWLPVMTLFPLGTVLTARLMLDQDERDSAQADLARAAAAAEQRAAEAELLTRASADLLSCDDRDRVFEVIEGFFGSLFPEDIIVVNETGGDGALFTRSIVGIDADLLRRGEELAGYRVIGRPVNSEDDYELMYTSGRMLELEGGLADVAGGELPRAAAEAIARSFGIHRVWTIGISDSDTRYAAIAILVRRAGARPLRSVVESFAHLCFVAFARIEAVGQLAESEAQQSRLFANMSEGLVVGEAILDDDGLPTDFRYVKVNASFERMMGWAAADVLGRTAREATPSVPQERIEIYCHVALTGFPARLESVSLDGEHEYDLIIYSPQPGQFAVIMSDVTERIAAERELDRHRARLEDLVAERTADLAAANEELVVANVELERAAEAKSTFLASMSHELRTPLNSIIGFSSLLVEGVLGQVTPQQRETVEIIHRSGQHLLALINDVLDLEKVAAGRVELRTGRFSPGHLMQEVAETVAPLAEEKGLDLRVAITGDASIVESDSGKVRQILLNLAGNAIKFTDAGHVELGVGVDE
ncbi:MAG: LytS/YhcK type 5TM receptor domain-containing protein, partial [Coriobacteriia bacterium]